MSFLFMEEVERGAAPLSCGKEDGKVVEIEATKILPNPAQPRRSFDEEALAAAVGEPALYRQQAAALATE